MVAINVLAGRYSLDDWKDFWERSGGGTDVIVAQDVNQRAVAAFSVRALGTTIIINRKGQVVYRDGIATPYETLRAEVDKAL